MSQAAPVRIVLQFRERPFQNLKAITSVFFAWREIQPLDNYYLHICCNPPSSKLYLVLDLYYKAYPNVDLDKLDLELFKVIGNDPLYATQPSLRFN